MPIHCGSEFDPSGGGNSERFSHEHLTLSHTEYQRDTSKTSQQTIQIIVCLCCSFELKLREFLTNYVLLRIL